MMRLLFFLLLSAGLAAAQTAPAPPASTLKPSPSHLTAAGQAAASNAMMQVSLDRLTATNLEFLEVLKKQQGVLEDLQFDRRLQSRQIQTLGVRLQETLAENARLQAKVAQLETAASAPPQTQVRPSAGTLAGAPAPAPDASKLQLADAPPPPPATYLPAPESEGAPGTKSWHRLFTLSGTDGQDSDLFRVQGPQWRVLWHNLDKPGKSYENTSALFISAFPKNDTIPQKVCSKLGSGGDGTELLGPGSYYLKVEASGGSWELAVEDFR